MRTIFKIRVELKIDGWEENKIFSKSMFIDGIENYVLKKEGGNIIIERQTRKFNEPNSDVNNEIEYDEKYKIMIPEKFKYPSYDDYINGSEPFWFWQKNIYKRKSEEWRKEKKSTLDLYNKTKIEFFKNRILSRKQIVKNYRIFCIDLISHGWKVIKEEKIVTGENNYLDS